MTKTQTLLTRRAFLTALLTMPAPLILAACAQQTQPTPVPAAPTIAPQPTAVPPTSSPATAIPATSVPPATIAAQATQPPNNPTIQPPNNPPTSIAQLAPTPTCGDDDDEPTIAQTEGPYFTPNSPERASLLEPDMTGTKLTVAGFVLSTDCTPIARALVDVWQCDDKGVYDNTGYRLRGHLFTDEQGHYRLETIEPGIYPGRTRHIHVKVQAPNNPVLTTQLYFPNEPRNQTDGIYRKECEMAIQNNADGSKNGAFNFVLKI